ncbi:hypothetical protein HDU76_002347, partial [Blyttiomyces sp. JEL0837]
MDTPPHTPQVAIKQLLPLLEMLEPMFSKRAVTSSRDAAGRQVDASLTATQLILASPSPPKSLILLPPLNASTKRFQSLLQLRSVLGWIIISLLASLTSLAADGRGSRGGSHRKKAVQGALLTARAAFTVADADVRMEGKNTSGTRKKPPTIAAYLPVEILEDVLIYVRTMAGDDTRCRCLGFRDSSKRKFKSKSMGESPIMPQEDSQFRYHPCDESRGEAERRQMRSMQASIVVIASVNRHWRLVSQRVWANFCPKGSVAIQRLIYSSLRSSEVSPSVISNLQPPGADSSSAAHQHQHNNNRHHHHDSNNPKKQTILSDNPFAVDRWEASSWLITVNMLSVELYEPTHSLLLRTLADRCPNVVSLSFRINYLRWSTFQHILLQCGNQRRIRFASDDSKPTSPHSTTHRDENPNSGLRRLQLRGCMEAIARPTEMTRLKYRLSLLESLDLDFTGGSSGDVRNKTIVAAEWILANVGNPGLRRLNVSVQTRLGMDFAEALARSTAQTPLQQSVLVRSMKRASISDASGNLAG